MCADIETCPEPSCLKDLTKLKGVTMFHHNIRGLFQNMANLITVFEQGENIDIYTMSETHIVNNSELDNDELYQIPGYHFVRKNRRNGQGGGVAIYISEKLNWKRRTDIEPENLESIWI
jgi:exonuclease III